MKEDRHDGLNLCPAFGELGADRVPESMGGHGWSALVIEESSGAARDLQGLIEQVVLAHRLASMHEHPLDGLLGPGVVA